MYDTEKWKQKRRLRCLLLFGFLILMGCGSQPAHRFLWWGQNSGRQLLARLDEGNRFFKEGDYLSAVTVFQDLKETGDQEVIRPALYGLACSRFMLAESKQEYIEAVEVFELWQRISPGSLEKEDPRMLLALFSKIQPVDLGEAPDGPRISENYFFMWFYDYEERIGELEDQIIELKKEIAICEQQKNAAEKMEAANEAMEETLKKKEDTVRSMAEELSKLRDQIKTFETIDQEIEEKKQGISSP